MKIAYICSPLKGDIERNQKRAAGYAKFAFSQGYIPMAPHLYFKEFLNDDNKEDRKLGMQAGIELLCICDELWVFANEEKPYISEGMQKEIDYWNRHFTRPIKHISE